MNLAFVKNSFCLGLVVSCAFVCAPSLVATAQAAKVKKPAKGEVVMVRPDDVLMYDMGACTLKLTVRGFIPRPSNWPSDSVMMEVERFPIPTTTYAQYQGFGNGAIGFIYETLKVAATTAQLPGNIVIGTNTMHDGYGLITVVDHSQHADFCTVP